MASLRSTIETLAAGNAQRHLELPLRLDLAPMALQCCMSLNAVGPEHVAVQSVERLCLEALGLLRPLLKEDPNRYDHLHEFAATLHGLFGESCTQLLFGRGGAAAPTTAGSSGASDDGTSNLAVFFARRNSGHPHPRTVRRALPAGDVYGGTQLHSLLNFFAAARARAGAVTFCPAAGRVVILADVAFDGMLLGAGTMVCERLMRLTGFEELIDAQGAQQLLNMDDAALQEWLKEHPLIESAVRTLRHELSPHGTHTP